MSTRAKKLFNQRSDLVEEMLEGYAAAYADIIRLTEGGLIVRRTPKDAGKVGLVIGNGSGHEPAMIGWVGYGLFDVNVPGPVFTAPPPAKLLEGIQAADRGAGVLVCVSHHAGDLMTAEFALAEAHDQGMADVEMVVLYDDVASAPRGREPDRRGTAGLFFVWKMLGAFAETGAPLAACKELAEKVRDNTRTISMALTSCRQPVTGEVMFHIGEDEMEIGMGVHGEAGTGRVPLLSADATIDQMLPLILEDLPFQAGDDVCVLLNNSGSMTLMELSILYRRVQQILDDRHIRVYRAWLGSYATTQEMAGFGLSLCRVDDQLKALYDAPANGAAFKSLGARP
ncbi:MAG: dihydroxyacetone kinase subunit DhaK [Caldilineaceae bacterium]|nr:dihydroxyacetone kinase subunit DhaK [Caldilineaceae bacterium]